MRNFDDTVNVTVGVTFSVEPTALRIVYARRHPQKSPAEIAAMSVQDLVEGVVDDCGMIFGSVDKQADLEDVISYLDVSFSED